MAWAGDSVQGQSVYLTMKTQVWAGGVLGGTEGSSTQLFEREGSGQYVPRVPTEGRCRTREAEGTWTKSQKGCHFLLSSIHPRYGRLLLPSTIAVPQYSVLRQETS